MKINSLALVALATALSGCSGNSLNNPLIFPESETPVVTDPTAPTSPSSPVTIPAALQNNLASAVVVPGSSGATDTLLVSITALDTTPINASWVRRPSLDVPGYRAFAVQEDALDRLFIGLAASSADGSASAVLAGDGGQFNTYYSGTQYSRVGSYTPPPATGSGPGTGQVSYKGKYIGLLNGGGARTETLPIPRGTTPVERPAQAARITGDVFMNANFADNVVNGVVKNRNAIDLAITNDPTSPVYNNGSGVAMEDVVMPKGAILVNGTFTGVTERPGNIDPKRGETGTFGGVIGGTNGSSIAGAIQLDKVYHNADDVIEGALERGVFVLDQCGLTTSGGDCAGTAP